MQACLSIDFQARIIASEVKRDENGSLGLEWDVIGRCGGLHRNGQRDASPAASAAAGKRGSIPECVYVPGDQLLPAGWF